jgi:hypothetical protein
VFVGAVQAARAEREARFLLWIPDLEAEEASLLAELVRVVTSAKSCQYPLEVERLTRDILRSR